MRFARHLHPDCVNLRGLFSLLCSFATVHALRIFVVEETVLPLHLLDTAGIEERQLLCSLDITHILQVTLCEDQIDLFQTALLRFWIKYVDEGQEACVDACKEKVRAPFDVVNHNRRDHDDQEVEKPVGTGGHGVGLAARFDWVHFCWVEPREREPCRGEEGDIGE
jgi:hypothetical protein